MTVRVRSCTRQEVADRLRPARLPSLAEVGDKLAAQFAELASRPCRDKCDRMLRELHEARTAVQQVRARLERHAA